MLTLRYVDCSIDDDNAELGSTELNAYTVHIPPKPDNRPISATDAASRAEEHYVSTSTSISGFTHAHHIDMAAVNPDIAASKCTGSSTTCAVDGCNDKPMPILPCECDFRICRECYVSAVKVTGGVFPGCKDVYRTADKVLAQMGRQPLS